MHIGLDTAVFYHDNIYCGTSRQLIIHPNPLRLTHIIVTIQHSQRLVPIAMLQSISHIGIHLRHNANELSQLDSFFKIEFSETTILDYGFTEYNYLFPLSNTQAWISIPIPHYNIPSDEYVISRQTEVTVKNKHIGQFKELIVDPETYHITQLVLQQGHLWERKQKTISASHIDHIDGDTISLIDNQPSL